MKKVYVAKDPMHAHLLLEILQSNDIVAVIQDENLFYVRGDIPVVYPSLWAPDEFEEAARRICADYDAHAKQPRRDGPWKCPSCGESIELEFTECWKCAKSEKAVEVAPDAAEVSPRRSNTMKWVLGIFIVLVVLSLIGGYYQERRRHASALFHEAIQLMRNGYDEKAVAKLDESAALNPRSALTLYNRGVAQSRLRHFEIAVADYSKALELNYDKPEQALSARARAYLNLEQPALATADCDRSIAIKPTANAYTVRAEIALANGRLAEAQEALARGLELDPGDLNTQYERGRIFFGTGDIEQAARCAETLVRVHPDRRSGYSLKGDVFWASGQMPEAITEYTHAIQIDRNDAYAYASRGLCQLVRGDLDAAKMDSTIATGLDPRMLTALQNRARVRRLTGQLDESRKDIDQITASKASWPGSHFVIAWAWAEKGDMERAQTEMRIAAEKLNWGWIRDYESAIVYCARARNLPPASVGEDSRKANIDNAIAHLQAASQKGFKFWAAIANDPDLKLLQDDPRYRAMASTEFRIIKIR